MKQTTITDDPSKLKTIIREQQKEIDLLRAQIQLLRHQRFGSTSEKFSPDQIPLFSTSPDDYNNAQEDQSLDVEVRSHKRKPKRRLGFADNLPVERVELDLPDAEKTCTCCNHALTKIGEESSKQVEHIPVSIKVKDYVRFK